MKKLIAFALFLSSTTAFAQVVSTANPSGAAPGPLQPPLTAADSAREAARQLNALQLRRQATAMPKLLPTTATAPPRHIASGEAIDATELAGRAQVRQQQEQQMINQALAPKRARKAAASAAAENDNVRRSK